MQSAFHQRAQQTAFRRRDVASAIEIAREDSLHSAIGGGAFSQLLPSAVLFNS